MSKTTKRPFTVTTKDGFIAQTTTYRTAQKAAARLIGTKNQTVFIDGPGIAVVAFSEGLGIRYES